MKTTRNAGHVEVRAGQFPGGVHGAGPMVGQDDAEGGELRLQVSAEADGDRDVADRVFQDQVPADDPGEDFAQRGVGIGVGAAGDGDHRGQFGITQPGEAAGDGDQDEGDGDGRTGRRTPVHQRARARSVAQQVDDQVEHLRVQDGGNFEVLAGGGRAGEHEDAAADDGADAERGQAPRAEGLLEPVLGLLGVGDQLVDGLAGEKLVAACGCAVVVAVESAKRVSSSCDLCSGNEG